MNLQVLVSTMHQNDHSILEKMNIQSNAIIINQCDRNEIEKFTYKGNSINFFSLSERGVGLSRNTALMRATADICLFADDDMEYIDGYTEKVLSAFNQLPDADIIIFDIDIVNKTKEISNYRKINKIKRLNIFNSMRYGACRIAVKRDKVIKSNIYYPLLFGGGAKYSAGEDSIFIRECIRKKLKLYAYPLVIAQVDDSYSTWYKGVNDKLLQDKGALLAVAFPKAYPLLFIHYALRFKKENRKKYSFFKTIGLFDKGRRTYYEE